MSTPRGVKERSRPSAGDDARGRLLAGLPVEERRLHLAGVSTAVLEGGDGPPVVLLHGPAGGTSSVQAALGILMQQFGGPPIAPEALARIVVPTTLIWGRHDLATRLDVAESASARYGWPLHVIEDCGDEPPLEQPEAFLRALHAGLGEVRP